MIAAMLGMGGGAPLFHDKTPFTHSKRTHTKQDYTVLLHAKDEQIVSRYISVNLANSFEMAGDIYPRLCSRLPNIYGRKVLTAQCPRQTTPHHVVKRANSNDEEIITTISGNSKKWTDFQMIQFKLFDWEISAENNNNRRSDCFDLIRSFNWIRYVDIDLIWLFDMECPPECQRNENMNFSTHFRLEMSSVAVSRSPRSRIAGRNAISSEEITNNWWQSESINLKRIEWQHKNSIRIPSSTIEIYWK